MNNKISTLCSPMDNLLTFGVERKACTLITGPEGSGKSQFCLQLAFSLQLPSCPGDTEVRQTLIIQPYMYFPFDRLEQISIGTLERFKNKHTFLPDNSAFKKALNTISWNKILQNTTFQYMDSSSQLLNFCTTLPDILEQRKIRLLVLNKFDDLLLKRTPCGTRVPPHEILPKIMTILQQMSSKFNMAVVITVQKRSIYSLFIYHEITSKLREYCNYHMSFEPRGREIFEARIIKSPYMHALRAEGRAAKFAIKECGLCELDTDAMALPVELD